MRFCQQQRQKEERDAKRAQLDARHRHVLSIVADCLRLEQTEVEDAVLEEYQVRKETSVAGRFQTPLIAFLPTPSTASQNYSLRQHAHSLLLPTRSTHLSDCNFLTRMLYKNSY